MSYNSTRNLILMFALALAISAVSLLISCGSDSPTGSGGGGGGGGREFVSPTLGPGATYTNPFATAKSVPYYCRFHGGPGGSGMSGVITVGAAGTPNKHNLSISSSSNLPDLTIEAGDTITWTNNTGSNHTVESDN